MSLHGLQEVHPQVTQIFRAECFSDEEEAYVFVAGELLLYSLTLPLTICLPLREKKKREKTAKGAETVERRKTRVGVVRDKNRVKKLCLPGRT